jgi:adenine deaminase
MTSIEWLIKELYTEMNMSGDGRVLDEILEEAKEMHKQEIIKAFDEGQEYEYQYHINNAPKFDSQTYYNETYGSGTTSSQTEKMYSEEEVIKFGEMIAWNMVGKTITESFIRTVSKELFKQIKKD